MPDVAVTFNTSPFIYVYPWDAVNGFGAKYTDPGTLGNNDPDVAFSPTSSEIFVTSTLTPFVMAFPWISGIGFGVKYTDPGNQLNSNGRGVAVDAANAAVAVALGGTPFIAAYTWIPGFGWGTRYANPSTLPAVSPTGNQVTFAPGRQMVFLSYSSAGAVILAGWPWSGSGGFGAKYTDPSGMFSGTNLAGTQVSCDAINFDVVVGASSGAGSLSMNAVTVDPVLGFGAAYTAPTGNLDAGGQIFNDVGNVVHISILRAGGAATTAYPFTAGSGFGAAYTDASGIGNILRGRIAIGAQGEHVTTLANSPFIAAWPFTVGGGFGTKYNNPATLPPTAGNGIAFFRAGTTPPPPGVFVPQIPLSLIPPNPKPGGYPHLDQISHPAARAAVKTLYDRVAYLELLSQHTKPVVVSGTQPVAGNQQRITNLAEPTGLQDAVPLKTLQLQIANMLQQALRQLGVTSVSGKPSG